MHIRTPAYAACLLALILLAGCGPAPEGVPAGSGKPIPEESPQSDANKQPAKKQSGDKKARERAANIAKLSPEDRSLAEAQGYCAVAEQPLGSMGVPVKILVNDQPVFLCCKGCDTIAFEEPDKTLA